MDIPSLSPIGTVVFDVTQNPLEKDILTLHCLVAPMKSFLSC